MKARPKRNAAATPRPRFTTAELSALLGISDRQIRNLVASDLLPAKGEDGQHDGRASIEAWVAYHADDREGSLAGAKKTFWRAKAAREETADRLERGELMRRRDAIAIGEAAMGIVANYLDGLGGRMAAELAALSEPALVAEAIDREAHEIRSRAAREIGRLGKKATR